MCQVIFQSLSNYKAVFNTFNCLINCLWSICVLSELILLTYTKPVTTSLMCLRVKIDIIHICILLITRFTVCGT